MSCRICHRSSCTESFHSLEDQERFAAREAMSDDVDTLRRQVQDLQGEITSLKADIEGLKDQRP
jgi:peptidoglycan hydrolase CwlO-like protein